ncbi:hypothetical protein [Buttiauxella ferragutiae]|uniref:hypothetical protein n=1 Tax=Buttiauxella ferragutiae TaxID=82989 RepID=UPI003523A88C
MLVRNTLTEALPLRARLGTVGLVLSLEGARYYVFHSHQSRDQIAGVNLQQKIALHHELLRGNQPYNHAQDQQKFMALLPFARAMVAQTHMEPEGRHAEESMIENWNNILHDFKTVRGHPPRWADVFLNFCPCQVINNNPSPTRVLDHTHYPISCHRKLQQFCSTGNRLQMKWTIYYEQQFQNAMGLNIHVGNLRIMKLPPYIAMPV